MSCKFCTIQFKTPFQLIRHVQLRHFKAGKLLLCVIHDCPASFSTIASLKVHVCKFHKLGSSNNFCTNITDIEDELSTAIEDEIVDVLDDGDLIVDPHAMPQVPLDDQSVIPISTSDDLVGINDILFSSIIHFYLQAKDNFLLSESAATNLSNCMLNMVWEHHDSIFNSLETFFKNQNLQHIFLQFREENNFCRIDLSYMESLLKKGNIVEIMTSHFNFVTPLEYTLSQNKVFHYIPLKDSLSSLLKNQSIFDQCKERGSCSFFSSCYFKNCLQNLAEQAIYLGLYADEFSLSNPLGPSKQKHKILGVYYKILNLDIALLSAVEQHHLIFLCDVDNVTHFGMELIFKPLVDELLDLFYNNLIISNKFKLPVIAVYMSGDNLSQHSILGMSKCFNSNNICRFCDINIMDVTNVVTDCDSTLRDDSSFYEHVVSQQFNVKMACIFECLPYISLPLFFPPDIMHDFLQGVTHTVVCHVLLDLIENKFLGMETLNSRLQQWLSFLPSPICLRHLKAYKLSMFTASQMLEFIVILPFLFGPYVPVDWPSWRILLLHCQIISYAFASDVSNINFDYFRLLISEHNHLLFKDLGILIKTKCKIHYLIHYPYFLQLYGSFRLLWTMRFEAMHQFFKQIMRTIKQFKNVTFSMAYRFQAKRCLEVSSSSYGKAVTSCLHLQPFSLHELLNEELVCLQQRTLSYSMSCERANILYVANRMYSTKESMVIVHSIEGDEDDPVFAEVKFILYIANKWFLLCHIYPSKFITHLNAYKLLYQSVYICIFPGEELFHPYLKTLLLFGDKYVVLEQHL